MNNTHISIGMIGFSLGCIFAILLFMWRNRAVNKRYGDHVGLLNSRLKSQSASFKELSQKYSYLDGHMKSICKIARQFNK